MPKEAHKVAHFCPMKITQIVRDYAAQLGVSVEAAIAKGLEEKAVEFKKAGAEIYKKALSCRIYLTHRATMILPR